MRVNIYAEEITEDIEIVEAKSATGATFKGIRFYLESSDKLHHTPQDNDRSAVTFWIKSDKGGIKAGDAQQLYSLFSRAVIKLMSA